MNLSKFNIYRPMIAWRRCYVDWVANNGGHMSLIHFHLDWAGWVWRFFDQHAMTLIKGNASQNWPVYSEKTLPRL